MPTFSYTARDSAGVSVTGTVTAGSQAEAAKQIRAEGKYPLSIREGGAPAASGAASPSASAPDADRPGGLKIPRADVIQISTQLSIMIETGVTISEALDCIAAQHPNPVTKKLVEDLAKQVSSGTSFSEALAKHPRSFPRLFVALIRAAEKSGMLSKLLNRATAYLRDEQETLRRVRGALTYPSIMLGFAVTTTIFLLAFVLPRFAVIYATKNSALPLPTQILMTMSNAIVHHWPWILAGLAATLSAGYVYFSSDPGRRVAHYLQLHTPLLGKMYRKLYLARGLRMLGTMGGAGINLVDCVATARDLTANTYFRELWEQVSTQIQSGRQLSEPLFRSPLVPRAVAQMLHSGEKGGKLASVMEQVATYSEQELKEQIADLTRYIEPIMILLMGLLIGGVALALLLPIFTISRVMSQ